MQRVDDHADGGRRGEQQAQCQAVHQERDRRGHGRDLRHVAPQEHGGGRHEEEHRGQQQRHEEDDLDLHLVAQLDQARELGRQGRVEDGRAGGPAQGEGRQAGELGVVAAGAQAEVADPHLVGRLGLGGGELEEEDVGDSGGVGDAANK